MFLFIKTLNPDKIKKQDLSKSLDICNLFNEEGEVGRKSCATTIRETELTNFLPVVVKDLVELESAFPKSFYTKDVNLQLDLQFLRDWPVYFS